MTDTLEIAFAPLSAAPQGTCAAFAANDVALGPTAQALNTRSGGAILKAAEAAEFKGKSKTAIELLALPKIDVPRLIVVGVGKVGELTDTDWSTLGGFALGQVAARKTALSAAGMDAIFE